MNVEAEKIELVKWLLETEDEALLQQVKNVFESHKSQIDFPKYVKNGIAKSKVQAKAGLLTPHDVVMEKYNKYL